MAGLGASAHDYCPAKPTHYGDEGRTGNRPMGDCELDVTRGRLWPRGRGRRFRRRQPLAEQYLALVHRYPPLSPHSDIPVMRRLSLQNTYSVVDLDPELCALQLTGHSVRSQNREEL